MLLIPVALGLAGHFGIFIDSRSTFRDRVTKVHDSLKENLTQFLTELLEYVNTVEDEPILAPLLRPALRGDGNTPDKVMRYTSETWRTFDLLTKVARAAFTYKIALYVLFFATFVGVALFIISILLPEFSAQALTVGLCVIGTQAVALCCLFVVSNSFEKYERAH